MPNRSFFIRLAAVIASGLMAAVLFPPFDLTALVWFCLIPLLSAVWSLDGRHRAKKGFLLGYIAGAISFGIQVSWLSTVSWLGPVVLAGWLALFWGAFGAFAATIGNPWHRKNGFLENSPLRSLFIAFTHATFFAGLEWLRGWLLTGFGWNGLGVAFHDTLVISQAADLLGVTGLSLLVVFFQCVLVQAGYRLWKGSREGQRKPRWDFADRRTPRRSHPFLRHSSHRQRERAGNHSAESTHGADQYSSGSRPGRMGVRARPHGLRG